MVMSLVKAVANGVAAAFVLSVQVALLLAFVHCMR